MYTYEFDSCIFSTKTTITAITAASVKEESEREEQVDVLVLSCTVCCAATAPTQNEQPHLLIVVVHREKSVNQHLYMTCHMGAYT